MKKSIYDYNGFYDAGAPDQSMAYEPHPVRSKTLNEIYEEVFPTKSVGDQLAEILDKWEQRPTPEPKRPMSNSPCNVIFELYREASNIEQTVFESNPLDPSISEIHNKLDIARALRTTADYLASKKYSY